MEVPRARVWQRHTYRVMHWSYRHHSDTGQLTATLLISLKNSDFGSNLTLQHSSANSLLTHSFWRWVHIPSHIYTCLMTSYDNFHLHVIKIWKIVLQFRRWNSLTSRIVMSVTFYSCIFFNTLCFSFIIYCFQCVLVSLLVLTNELLLLRHVIAQHMKYVIKFTFTMTMMLIFPGSRPDTRWPFDRHFVVCGRRTTVGYVVGSALVKSSYYNDGWQRASFVTEMSRCSFEEIERPTIEVWFCAVQLIRDVWFIDSVALQLVVYLQQFDGYTNRQLVRISFHYHCMAETIHRYIWY